MFKSKAKINTKQNYNLYNYKTSRSGQIYKSKARIIHMTEEATISTKLPSKSLKKERYNLFNKKRLVFNNLRIVSRRFDLKLTHSYMVVLADGVYYARNKEYEDYELKRRQRKLKVIIFGKKLKKGIE